MTTDPAADFIVVYAPIRTGMGVAVVVPALGHAARDGATAEPPRPSSDHQPDRSGEGRRR